MNAPEPLASTHLITEFDCGKPSLNDWLKRHALQSQGSGSARTFVVTQSKHKTKEVIAYYSLVVGQVEPLAATERIRKGMGQYPIPVMLLARLAVSQSAQGQGLGIGLLQDAIRRTLQVAEHVGIRALATHPIDEAATQFYQRFGFEASPLAQDQLLILLKDARRVLG
jgi:GNAT superfamily N-acetyltransferase